MISARNILNNSIVFNDYRYISEEDYYKESKRTLIKEKDVLLTIVGTIGRSAVVKKDTKFTLQRSVAVISTHINPFYLSYYFQCPFSQKFFESIARGTAQKGIYLNQLHEVPVPIAPLDEQSRIANKLDELFARLDNGEKQLQKIQTLIKRYEQSISKSAFEGKISESWRKANQITSSWKIVSLENITKVGVGYVGPTKKYYTDKENGYPIFSTKNVSEKGFVSKEANYVNDDFYYKNKTRIIESGDLIITRHGNSGSAAVIPEGINNAFCLNVVFIKKSNLFKSKYLEYLLNNLETKKSIFKHVSGSVQGVMNTKVLKELQIKLPDIGEQDFILKKIEQQSSLIDKIENGIIITKKQIIMIKNLILKTAFEGKLLLHNDVNESASILLERILRDKVI